MSISCSNYFVLVLLNFSILHKLYSFSLCPVVCWGTCSAVGQSTAVQAFNRILLSQGDAAAAVKALLY